MSLGALLGPSRQLTMVTDHTIDVVSQLMLIRDVFDATCMYFVSSAFFLPKMAAKLELTPINPMLDYFLKNQMDLMFFSLHQLLAKNQIDTKHQMSANIF